LDAILKKHFLLIEAIIFYRIPKKNSKTSNGMKILVGENIG